MRRAMTLIVAGLFLTAGCGKPTGSEKAASVPDTAPAATAAAPQKSEPAAGHDAKEHAPGATAESQHAEASVVPGSYEDWCGEHQVPESMCTRCNPSLIAAFKATGDWCEEHGLPESQCLICNPDLKIERPPRPEGG